jgi:hypothetical protein
MATAPESDERHLGQEPRAGLRLGCFAEPRLKHRDGPDFLLGRKLDCVPVVRNYLRWFELRRCKKATDPARLFAGLRSFWHRNVFPRIDAFSEG